MATRNIVPRATGEGSIGTSAKTWGAMYTDDLSVTNTINGTANGAISDGNGNNIVATYQPVVVGAVIAFAGSTSPTGWLLCDGSAVSRTTYADLYAVIGDTYGAGDGSTTFNLPNLVDKFVEGSATSGTVKSAGLPNIEGSFAVYIPRSATPAVSNSGFSEGDGAFARSTPALTKYYSAAGDTTNNTNTRMTIDASRSSAIYGNSTTVQPPAVTMRYIIKC